VLALTRLARTCGRDLRHDLRVRQSSPSHGTFSTRSTASRHWPRRHGMPL
jgi:hypothetical protein